VTKKQAVLFAKIGEQLRSLRSIFPTNPCDVERKVVFANCADRVAGHHYMVISHIGFGDLDEARERLAEAERDISESKVRARAASDRFYQSL